MPLDDTAAVQHKSGSVLKGRGTSNTSAILNRHLSISKEASNLDFSIFSFYTISNSRLGCLFFSGPSEYIHFTTNFSLMISYVFLWGGGGAPRWLNERML